ncbi:MAG: ribosome maturation factor RimM [Ilumatobacteraceae bacterium]
MASEQPEVREVGRIGRAHGVRGELYVDLITDRDSRLAVGARVRAGQQWLTVAAARPQAHRWLVTFEGVADRNAADALVGRLLYAEPLDSSDDADADDLWVHELIGSRVVEVDGTDRGACTSVLDNPAHDILELDGGWLVPVTFVVGFADGVITIDPPDGLFEA